MNKSCTKCKIEKSIDEFSKWNRSSDGYFHHCKSCCKIASKLYREKNKDSLNRKNRLYWKTYYIQNKHKINQKHRANYRLYGSRWKPTRKQYNEVHRDHLYEMAKKRLTNPIVKDARNRKASIRDRIRRKEDINYKIKKNLRCRIWNALKGNYKTKKSTDLLGCSIDSFKEYIAARFTDEMTWENYGKWHIDHIIPCDRFDLIQPSEQERCFHYTNLQPLWAIENLRKNNKVI